MQIRQFMLASPWRPVGAAVFVILLFAALFPFAGFGESLPTTGQTVTYVVNVSDLPQLAYALFVFEKSLHLSVRTFALGGPSNFTLTGTSAYLADVEALLGMGFLALFTASLVRVE